MSDVSDIYQRVTDQIVASLEAGAKAGDWSCPWNSGRSTSQPVNAQSRKPYRGINVVALWAGAEVAGYASGEWATYKQWAELGAQVRKGQHSTQIVFWKQMGARTETTADGEEKVGRVTMMAKAYSVFNAAQVDGYTPKGVAETTPAERDAATEVWFAAVGANVVHKGGRACYVPSQDLVMMPEFEAFSEATGYYSVLAHELTHWTGAKARLDRKLEGRFGDESYAAEELVAELGAAFTLAARGLSLTPRKDHASYIASWIRVLKADKRAIFTAAAAAQKAADYLAACAEPADVAAEAAAA